ncbi:MAG: hypothetical protein KatS3mg027_0819 [Bacteroidia bacterium]|nr:MAG: hypothetical protein KatS3mg027_0819 [Bacteroidia bacterium]
MTIKESIKNLLNKIPAFFSGMLVGIVLTGVFFLFKINEYLLQIKDTLYPKMTVITQKAESNEKINKPNTKKIKRKENLKSNDKNDTTIDFIEYEKENSSAVIQEKITSEKEIKIIHLENESPDTLLNNLSDVPHYANDNAMRIVFKKTPFNNKGYYFENNYLVLVGLEDIPYINLYEYKGELYIKYDKLVFKLPYTNEFSNLIKINDEYLLARMN